MDPPHRFGGSLFQGACNVNDCVPFWVFVALVAVQLAGIFVSANTVDSETGKLRLATMGEKIRLALSVIVIDLVIGVNIFLLCRSCSSGWAWAVLFTPLIVLGLYMFIFLANSPSKDEILKAQSSSGIISPNLNGDT